MFWLMLDGGPCAGGYRTQRAPANLKAVRVPPRGKPDVLDLPDDQARDDEEIYLYERTSAQSEGIVCVRGSGCGHIVLYRYVRPLRGQLTLFAPDGGAEVSTPLPLDVDEHQVLEHLAAAAGADRPRVDDLPDAVADRILAGVADRLAPADRAATRSPVGWS